MARPSNLDKLSYAQLSDLKARVEKAMTQKRDADRSKTRDELMTLARDRGFDLRELLNGRAKNGRGVARSSKVAPKYRDPKNSQNTWTGRGRMPLWMVAATKGGKAKKEDFLIK